MAEEPAQNEDATAEGEPVVEPERLHGALVVRTLGEVVLHCDRSELVGVVTALRADGYWQCLDLCGVDYLTHPGRTALPSEVQPERFEVVVSLINHQAATRIRVRVQVPADDAVVPALFAIHPGTEAMEREAFDLLGISFEGHPDMTRILLPDEWSGHPLRKDYAIGRIPVQFKGAPSAR